MLQDLHDVAINARQRFRNEFSTNEIVLSDRFKELFGTSLRRDHQSIDFTAHTAIVTTSGNLKMYIPNQWFCAAAYTVPFIQTLNQYKKLLWECVIPKLCTSPQEKKDYIKRLKETKDTAVITDFRANLHNVLASFIPANELEETTQLVLNFATNYEWWFGNKTIDRSDCYVSPVLSLLSVVNASQSYIADISYKFSTEAELASAALDMISTTPRDGDATDVHPPKTPTDATRLTGGINEIVYGAPGTGKSKYLDDTYSHTTISTRVVFHPEYTIFDFVGTYKPVPVYKQTNTELYSASGEHFSHGEPYIDYRYVPGPFVNCLVDAWLDPEHMHTLIIEEINRANTAAVFGEVFQLLDRDINGTSEYAIAPSEDLKQYLLSIDGLADHITNGIRIPSNMNIVATMNSADQGVMPMDSAFKRRWSFKYIRIAIEGAVHEYTSLTYANLEVYWGNLVRAINYKLSSLGFGEDRLVGPFFIRPDEIGSSRATDKLLLYLWDDVLRHNHSAFFSSQISNFADLSECFSTSDVFDLYSNVKTTELLTAPAPAVLVDEATEDVTENQS